MRLCYKTGVGVIALALLLSIGLATNASAQNLVLNPDFETGDLSN